jgi:cobalt/nickel transport system permease protein
MHHKFLDQHSGLKSFLHRLDPRTKIIAFIGIVFFVVFTPASSPVPFFFYAALVFSCVAFSRVPWRFVLLRALSVLPFVLIVALPLVIRRPSGQMAALGYILAKSVLAMVSVTVLVSTTYFADLLKGLQELRCPVLFLMIFSFLYRYVYLLMDEVMEMNQARESRAISKNQWLEIRTLANMAGNLFIRSYEKGEQVYLSMCSRGYDGRTKTLGRFAFGRNDRFFLGAVLTYLVSVCFTAIFYGIRY